MDRLEDLVEWFPPSLRVFQPPGASFAPIESQQWRFYPGPAFGGIGGPASMGLGDPFADILALLDLRSIRRSRRSWWIWRSIRRSSRPWWIWDPFGGPGKPCDLEIHLLVQGFF